MKQLIFLIFLFNYALAYEFKLNKKDLTYIDNSSRKSFILNRLTKYENMKTEIKDYELIKKLSYVNTFMNKTFSVQDISSQSSIDHWATPKEFLLQGHGDCEDYAIAKYFTLLEVGIPKEKLYFAVVDVKGEKASHMVLLYLEDKKSTPLVLDNLSFLVIPFTKRKNLIPKFAFNEIDSYQFTSENFTEKVKINWGKENKWEKLLFRDYTLNE
jgi:predicted transglutaminase-like cysteine proteinase